MSSAYSYMKSHNGFYYKKSSLKDSVKPSESLSLIHRVLLPPLRIRFTWSLFVYLFVRFQLHITKKTTERIFMKILPEMYLWTSKVIQIWIHVQDFLTDFLPLRRNTTLVNRGWYV